MFRAYNSTFLSFASNLRPFRFSFQGKTKSPFTCQNLHTLNPRPRCRTFKLFCRPSSSAVAHTLPCLSGDLDRYLRCSMPQNLSLRVTVLVSGGFDSSSLAAPRRRPLLHCFLPQDIVPSTPWFFCRKISRTFGLSAPGKTI